MKGMMQGLFNHAMSLNIREAMTNMRDTPSDQIVMILAGLVVFAYTIVLLYLCIRKSLKGVVGPEQAGDTTDGNTRHESNEPLARLLPSPVRPWICHLGSLAGTYIILRGNYESEGDRLTMGNTKFDATAAILISLPFLTRRRSEELDSLILFVLWYHVAEYIHPLIHDVVGPYVDHYSPASVFLTLALLNKCWRWRSDASSKGA